MKTSAPTPKSSGRKGDASYRVHGQAEHVYTMLM